MQEFNAPYILTGGGPLGKTRTIGMYIYEEMFTYGDAGTANAVSWVLFVLIARHCGYNVQVHGHD